MEKIGWEATRNVTLLAASPVYSPHLMMRQIYGKATSDRPSCVVCIALPFVSM